MLGAVQAFLLAFPALLSIVNPLTGAFIFNEVAAGWPPSARTRIARRVGLYALIVMLVALWAGSFVLSFFGISLAALRVAGGLAVALNAWDLLSAPERREARKQAQAAPAEQEEDVAFFPLTIPFTTGPGTIAVCITLGAGYPRHWAAFPPFFIGVSAAAMAMAIVIWLSFASADRITAWLGPSASRTITRLFAFLLLCIGVQILISGFQDVLEPMLRPAG